MRVLHRVAVAVAFLFFAPTMIFAGTISYDSLNRISFIDDLQVNGILYDVSVDWLSAVNGTAPGPGDLPDSDAFAAAVEITTLNLGTTSVNQTSNVFIGSSVQSGQATNPYDYLARVQRVTQVGPSMIASGPGSVVASAHPGTNSAIVGIPTFTVVPEPASIVLGMGATLLLLGLRVSR